MPKKKQLLPFGWYGGKFSHLPWLLPLLPNAHHYVEPFGGSGAVLLNRIPSPLETYNDLDGYVTNFFAVLRDRPGELIEKLQLTLYSRSELQKAITAPAPKCEVEKARRFFVRIRQAVGGRLAKTDRNWSYCIGEAKCKMSGSISKWLSSIAGLEQICERLRRVQIENLPAVKVIQKYDTPKTLFYLDPPYVWESRVKGHNDVYLYEMTDEQHRELARVLDKVKGKVALSGYSSPLYCKLYAGWRITKEKAKRCSSGKRKGLRQECLWTNYDPRVITGQMVLF